MARVNVFLGEDLLKAVDSEAEAEGMNRSALIQKALADYLEARRQAREAARARDEMGAAARGMDRLAERLGDWDPGRIIRESRDQRLAALRESRVPYRTRRKSRR